MSRKIVINKYQGNTQYSVSVEDSYGTEHHLGYLSNLTIDELKFLNYPTYGHTMLTVAEQAEEIWGNEVKPKKDSLGDAIAECIQSDIDRGVEPSLD
jgi:hypothetical protein